MSIMFNRMAGSAKNFEVLYLAVLSISVFVVNYNAFRSSASLTSGYFGKSRIPIVFGLEAISALPIPVSSSAYAPRLKCVPARDGASYRGLSKQRSANLARPHGAFSSPVWVVNSHLVGVLQARSFSRSVCDPVASARAVRSAPGSDGGRPLQKALSAGLAVSMKFRHTCNIAYTG